MALDISGIDNVGEFYSHHYLSAVLEGDLKSVLKQWRDREKAGEGRSPHKALASLANHYFAARNRASEASSVEERWKAARDFHVRLIEVLGYEDQGIAPVEHLESGELIPLVASLDRDGSPFLWIADAAMPHRDDDEDDDGAFDLRPLADQLPEGVPFDNPVFDGTWQELFDGPLFREDRPPRWILYLAAGDAWLIERHKWPHGQCLHFHLAELFGRRESDALKATAALLHRDVLAPDAGACLHDTLDEKSHKHAFAVSTDLKHGVRRAVELLANEVVFYWKDVRRGGVYQREVDGEIEKRLDPKQLTRECLIWLYRMLFLFYAEARGKELGVVPMDSTTYRLGYSLESLRDLELVPLHTDQARNGTYIHDSLNALFRILNRGYNQRRAQQLVLADEEGRDAYEAGDRFQLLALRSRLFDEDSTPLLKPARLRNDVMQEILQLLSLSKGSRKQGRGRISYAQLGINQLGAVYEGLLSYSGFFAEEDLVEVKAKTDMDDPEARSYFVPKSDLGRYHDDEIVRDDDGQPVEYPRGTFVFRLAGRDREKSASYYTPEVLTECLTRYTLKERLDGLSADEILDLTVCEPAMGSGAFLNEAVNQLADAYLDRKQEELEQYIPADEYQAERQKVKYHFAVNNCYGVDLNPLAAELGKVSLWLNVLHPGARAPFFDLRIGTGNSLMGGRREVFRAEHLTFKSSKKKGTANWLDRVPERVPMNEPRPQGTVWHFLLPDAGMAPFDKDKVVKGLVPDAVARVKEWRSSFTTPFKPLEVRTLERLSARVDALWQEHAVARRQVAKQLFQTANIWGQEASKPGVPVNEETATELYQRVFRAPNAPGRRLAAVMDAWCALWVWPLGKADLLPTRDEWLTEVEALLDSLDVTATLASSQRLRVVKEVTERAPCFHWDLYFADVFAGRGGFDVVLGNPPWLKLRWVEAGVLGDYDPALALQQLSAKQFADARGQVLESREARSAYFREFEGSAGVGKYLNSTQAYPLLRGVQTNLYKCFMTLALELGNLDGIVGLIHSKGVYDDPRGGRLRAALAQRLRWHLHFINKLKLFESIKDEKHYELSIYGARRHSTAGFRNVSNLFHPRTLDHSESHDGQGVVPGITDKAAAWCVRGHKSRIVHIDRGTLALFARLFDSSATAPDEARIPIVHSRETLSVLRRFADVPCRLRDLGSRYFATEHFHETNQQRDGTIVRRVSYPHAVEAWVVSGPHLYVGNPLNKTPNEGCRHRQDYSAIDLTEIPTNYVPRTIYVPACSAAEYQRRTPHWKGRPLTYYFRHAHREMVPPSGERTLAPAILPAGAAHLNTVFGIAFDRDEDLLTFNGMTASLICDFFVKSTGMGHVNDTLSGQLPLATQHEIRHRIARRVLRLNCLTEAYRPLWDRCYGISPNHDGFTKADARLGTWPKPDSKWSRESALRTPYERRQTLVELDALASLALGIACEELCLAYSAQFPTLQDYERDTYYDQRGKVVFTVNRGLSGVGLDRRQWGEIKSAQMADALPDWARDATGPYEPPFDRCDRQADMREAYAHFERVLEVETR